MDKNKTLNIFFILAILSTFVCATITTPNLSLQTPEAGDTDYVASFVTTNSILDSAICDKRAGKTCDFLNAISVPSMTIAGIPLTSSTIVELEVFVNPPILGEGEVGDPYFLDTSSVTMLGPTVDHAELSNLGLDDHFDHADDLTELNTQISASLADGAHTIDTNTNASTECTGSNVLEGSGACVANASSPSIFNVDIASTAGQASQLSLVKSKFHSVDGTTVTITVDDDSLLEFTTLFLVQWESGSGPGIQSWKCQIARNGVPIDIVPGQGHHEENLIDPDLGDPTRTCNIVHVSGPYASGTYSFYSTFLYNGATVINGSVRFIPAYLSVKEIR